MAKDGELKNQNDTASVKTLHKSIEFQRIGNAAVHKAQEENRRLGVPNWYFDQWKHRQRSRTR